MPANIAYFVNQYPAVSHSFIRREILGLEERGFTVTRIALYGWASEVVDEVDVREREQTRYVLEGGTLRLLISMVFFAICHPISFMNGLKLAFKMSGDRGKPISYHMAYLAEACRMLPWLKSRTVQHVHAHFGTNSTEVVMLVSALGGPPYSFTVHGPDEFDQPAQLGLAEKVNRSAFTVAITSYAKAQICRWASLNDWSKVRVVRCGLEDSFFERPAASFPSENKFVCVGRLSEQKGQLLLLQAMKVLVDEGMSAQLTMIGAGPMREQIQEYIDELSLNDYVELTGALPTPEMLERIQDSKALVLPSFAEGLPMVIMEAMGLRRPVLATYIAGIPELVKPGENGWLVPAGSVEALVEGMREVVNTAPERLEKMGENALQSVRKLHSVRLQSQALDELIKESCSQGAMNPTTGHTKMVSV